MSRPRLFSSRAETGRSSAIGSSPVAPGGSWPRRTSPPRRWRRSSVTHDDPAYATAANPPVSARAGSNRDQRRLRGFAFVLLGFVILGLLLTTVLLEAFMWSDAVRPLGTSRVED